MLIAQISDPHVSTPGAVLFGGYRPDDALPEVLERLAGLDPRPDIVWLTGDLVENGTPEEYATLRAHFDGFALPVAAIPGNHDRRGPFAAGLAGSGIRTGTEPFLQLVVEDFPLRMIGLDTVVEGAPGGLLCRQRLDWLAARLAEAPGRPTLVFMHHPPFATGIRFSDATGCAGAEALAGILAEHRNVVGVSCGHVHRPVRAAWAGTVAGICPSVAWALPLELAPVAAPRFAPQRPGFQLHLWNGGGLVTHTEFVAER